MLDYQVCETVDNGHASTEVDHAATGDTGPADDPLPTTFSVDYPDRPLNRLTTGLRFIWIIPIGVIAGLLGSGTLSAEGTGYSWSWAAGGVLVLPVLLMILFRQKYPRWWFDWNLNLSRFLARVAYMLNCSATSTPPPTRSRRCTWTSLIRMRSNSIAGSLS